MARKHQNEVGEDTTNEVRRRLWLYGFLLKAQRSELQQCLLNECNEHGYEKMELMEAINKVGENK